MILITILNVIHATAQVKLKKYKMNINNLKVGDLVYPAYDGKGRRCTAGKVIEVINPTTIKVNKRKIIYL